jgi:hypothetical protein
VPTTFFTSSLFTFKKMKDETWQIKKYELMAKISHLNTLCEVSEGYPAWVRYSEEMDKLLYELRDHMASDKVKEEQKQMKLN